MKRRKEKNVISKSKATMKKTRRRKRRFDSRERCDEVILERESGGERGDKDERGKDGEG